MSDFGADTSDFHSDFASDFRTEGSDYASDFHDFPGDFCGEPRTAKQPPEANENAPPEQWTATGKATGERERRQAGSAPHKRQAKERWKNVTPQGHKQRAQGKRDGGGIGIALNIKTPYRRVKIANRAYSRKAAEIHREQKKNPAQREPCGARLFLEFCKVKQQQNGLQQDIQQDQGRHLLTWQL